MGFNSGFKGLKLKIEQKPLHSSSYRRQDCLDGGSDHYKHVSWRGKTESWTNIRNTHTSSGIGTADLEFEGLQSPSWLTWRAVPLGTNTGSCYPWCRIFWGRWVIYSDGFNTACTPSLNKRAIVTVQISHFKLQWFISCHQYANIFRVDILIETTVKEIEQNQLTWYGHVQRMVGGLPKIALKWMPKQKRARGRPKKNWMEGIR